jgi:hypothetical protein
MTDKFPILKKSSFPSSFHENEFDKYGKEQEEKCVKIFNCPYHNSDLFFCSLCEGSHCKPKSYTGKTFSKDNENNQKTMGITLKRRDLPQFHKSQ